MVNRRGAVAAKRVGFLKLLTPAQKMPVAAQRTIVGSTIARDTRMAALLHEMSARLQACTNRAARMTCRDARTK
jgi:hypothetical protein